MIARGASGGFRQSLRRLPGRTPLRIKMITAVLTLVIIALTVISVASISVLRSYLLDQADSRLQSWVNGSAPAVLQYLQGAKAGDQNGVVVEWLPQGGHTLHQVIKPGTGFRGIAQQMAPGPVVSPDASWIRSADGQPLTVAATSGDGRWRVVAFPHQFEDISGDVASGTVIVGLDVSNEYATLGRLTAIDLLVSAIVIVGLAVVGVAVVRASLRPLSDIEQTAEAIAAGDLTRRVPDLDPRTEVGRLGRSLNAMLSQIETAFRAQAKSEAAARRSEERMRQFVADASHELRTPLTAIRGFAEYYRQRGGVEAGPGDVAGPAATSGSADGAESAVAEAGPASGAGSAAAASGPGSGPEREPGGGPGSEPGGGPGGWPGGGPEGEPGGGPAEAAPATGGPTAIPALAGNGSNGIGQLAPQDLDRIMRRVEQESSRMGVLVEDMLLLARLDQQRPLDRHTVDLLTLAADAVHDARVVAPGRNIHLTVGAGAALLVLGDEVRLRQVIGNLMSNALAHTPDGTPIDVRIRSGSLDEARAAGVVAAPGPPPAQVSAPPQPPLSSAAPNPPVPPSATPPAQPVYRQPAPSRSAAVLEVTDHGPGLSREQAEHAFERFYRADQARTTRGTGLGLAIVAALVAAHGGAVWVESAPGAGATFRIALPLAPEALHTDDEHADDGLGDEREHAAEPQLAAEHDSATEPQSAGDHESGEYESVTGSRPTAESQPVTEHEPATEPGPSAGPHDGAEPGPGTTDPGQSGSAGPSGPGPRAESGTGTADQAARGTSHAAGGTGPAAEVNRW